MAKSTVKTCPQTLKVHQSASSARATASELLEIINGGINSGYDNSGLSDRLNTRGGPRIGAFKMVVAFELCGPLPQGNRF